MVRLRSPDGCPWDREQKMEDLARYIREEAAEVVAAIKSGDAGHTAEELGDLLFNIIFAARLGEEEGISSYFWGSEIRGLAYLEKVQAAREEVRRHRNS